MRKMPRPPVNASGITIRFAAFAILSRNFPMGQVGRYIALLCTRDGIVQMFASCKGGHALRRGSDVDSAVGGFSR